MNQWYVSARNLGVLEASVFLKERATCSEDSGDPAHDSSWPFCKPYITIENAYPFAFEAHNVWPAAAVARDHLTISVRVDGVADQIDWPLRFDARGLAFRHGTLDLDFGPSDLPERIRMVRPDLQNVVVDAIGLTDGQSSAERDLR
jgi:hypothetical protein